MKTKWSTILIVLLSLSSIINAESVKKVAQAKMQFLKLGVGARAAAMGDAVLALSGDANAIFYNPAGCASVQGLG